LPPLAALALLAAPLVNVSIVAGDGCGLVAANASLVEPIEGVITGYTPFVVVTEPPVSARLVAGGRLVPLTISPIARGYRVAATAPVPLGVEAVFTLQLQDGCRVEILYKPSDSGFNAGREKVTLPPPRKVHPGPGGLLEKIASATGVRVSSTAAHGDVEQRSAQKSDGTRSSTVDGGWAGLLYRAAPLLVTVAAIVLVIDYLSSSRRGS
jgi:hypothetical protein